MSDYLNNIVARSLNVADVVQPRVPHLFEQTVAATPVDPEPVSTGESVSETMFDSGATPRASYSPTPPAPVNPTVTTPMFDQLQPDSPAPVALPPTPVLQTPSMPVPEIRKRSQTLAAPNASALRTKSVPPQVPTTQPAREINQYDGRVAEPVVPTRVGPPQIEPPAPIPKSEAVTHKTISQAVPAALTQVNRTEPQLPPIRINIGRVDVRAIMPAAPPVTPAAPRPRPALSLESYLKQREEGKR